MSRSNPLAAEQQPQLLRDLGERAKWIMRQSVLVAVSRQPALGEDHVGMLGRTEIAGAVADVDHTFVGRERFQDRIALARGAETVAALARMRKAHGKSSSAAYLRLVAVYLDSADPMQLEVAPDVQIEPVADDGERHPAFCRKCQEIPD